MKLMNIQEIKRVFIVIAFSMLFEYSLRGIGMLLIKPFMFFFIFMVYFGQFMLTNDIISRFKLKDYHLVLLAIVFNGFYSLFFLPGSYWFTSPLFLGINWLHFILLFFIFQASIQNVMAFYLANRFIKRKWGPTISKKSWILIFILYIGVGILFRLGIEVQQNFLGIVSILIIITTSLILIKKSLPIKHKKQEKSKIMDILTFLTVILFITASLMPINIIKVGGYHYVNKFSFMIVVPWVIFASLVMWAYRLLFRKEIAI